MKKNLAISLLVLFVAYAALEVTFLSWFPRLLPTAFVLSATDEGLHPALQSSKQSTIPQHYIALLGDSHAQGMGDWATEAMKEPMARYGTAHLLQPATGRDVVSFGSAGAGSVRGIVTEPLTQLAYLRRYVNGEFPDPDVALVYFYEGNDLYDNAAYFHYSFPRLYDIAHQHDAATYREYLQRFAIDRDDTWRLAQSYDPWRFLPFSHLLDKVARTIAGKPLREEPLPPGYDASLDPPWIMGAAMYREPGTINRALIGGQEQQLPDQLQGPALGLTDEETRQAWFALEQALLFTRQQLPDTRFVLVYIPSVASCYSLVSEQVSVQPYERRETSFPRAELLARSLAMRETVRGIAQSQGLPLIDTTDAMRTAASAAPLHGPGDWNHPNRQGYEVLSRAIASGLQPLLQE